MSEYLSLEEKAIALSQDKVALLKRLMKARLCLKQKYLAHFPYQKCKLDFEKKRLLGVNNWALQWELRDQPYQPESPHNQQTSCGRVSLIKIGGLSEEEKAQLIRDELTEFFNCQS